MGLFNLNEMQNSERDATVRKDSKQIKSLNSITYLTDTHYASKNLTEIIERMMLNECSIMNSPYVIHAHIEIKNGKELIKCLYIIKKPDELIIYVQSYDDSVFTQISRYFLKNSDYFSYSCPEFKYHLRGLIWSYTKDFDKVATELWEKIRVILKDEEIAIDTSEMIIEEFSFDWNLEMCEDAKAYWNKKLIFQLIEKKHSKQRMVRCFSSGDDQKFLDLFDASNLRIEPTQYEDHFRSCFNVHREEIIRCLPGRCITVYHYVVEGYYCCHQSLRLLTPSESADTCLIYLKSYTEERYPYPQGYQGGCTFKKVIDAPKCEFSWSDDQLIQKYKNEFQ